jgi:pyruvate/2-oxoglutarate dehydrogenase complex dihydrolipoamide acyltransferase (E2) component
MIVEVAAAVAGMLVAVSVAVGSAVVVGALVGVSVRAAVGADVPVGCAVAVDCVVPLHAASRSTSAVERRKASDRFLAMMESPFASLATGYRTGGYAASDIGGCY